MMETPRTMRRVRVIQSNGSESVGLLSEVENAVYVGRFSFTETGTARVVPEGPLSGLACQFCGLRLNLWAMERTPDGKRVFTFPVYSRQGGLPLTILCSECKERIQRDS